MQLAVSLTLAGSACCPNTQIKDISVSTEGADPLWYGPFFQITTV